MKNLQLLLQNHGFYCDMEELNEAKEEGFLELVKKASGDSYGRPVEEVFGDDYKKLMKLLKKDGISVSEEVWYD